MMNTTEYDVAVIGSGVGDLTCGALPVSAAGQKGHCFGATYRSRRLAVSQVRLLRGGTWLSCRQDGKEQAGQLNGILPPGQ
jgi:hypothetical protein